MPLQKPPTSSVWFAFPWDLTVLSSPAGPGSTHPSHRLAAPAAPHLGMPGRHLAISFGVRKKIIDIGNFFSKYMMIFNISFVFAIFTKIIISLQKIYLIKNIVSLEYVDKLSIFL